MNFSEALELLKQGKKVERINCYGYVAIYYLEDGTLYKQDDYCTQKVGMMPAERLLDDSWEEYKEPLLTKEEKEYLKMVIKFSPFEIINVCLCNDDVNSGFLRLCGNSKNDLTALFTKGYFKNLVVGKEYTLEELDLKD